VPRDGIEPPTRGFSERQRARPPPFVEALLYWYVVNITTTISSGVISIKEETRGCLIN